MQTLDIFIISWPGQHDRAAQIAAALTQTPHSVTVVFSDPNPSFSPTLSCRSIRRPHELFWGDKFKACIDATSADLMMVIHADCDSVSWPELVAKGYNATRSMPNGGMWAPLIEGTPWPLQRTELATLKDSPLSVVAQTDALVFCITRPLVERMRSVSYADNLYGWGIDWMLVAHAYATAQLVVVDRSAIVKHPFQARGYSDEAAQAQMEQFLLQLHLNEFIQYTLLRAHVNRPLSVALSGGSAPFK
jgi:hypothetical protein